MARIGASSTAVVRSGQFDWEDEDFADVDEFEKFAQEMKDINTMDVSVIEVSNINLEEPLWVDPC